jgi:hypothetical protein
VQIVVNCETRLCSQFLGHVDRFFFFFGQSFGAFLTDRAATGLGNLVDQVSTFEKNSELHDSVYQFMPRCRVGLACFTHPKLAKRPRISILYAYSSTAINVHVPCTDTHALSQKLGGAWRFTDSVNQEPAT